MKKGKVGSLHLIEYLTVELDFDVQLKRLTIIVEVRKRFCNIKLAHSFMAASRTIDRQLKDLTIVDEGRKSW